MILEFATRLLTPRLMSVLLVSVFLVSCAHLKEAQVSDHFDGRVFFNPGLKDEKGFGDFIKWARTRNAARWPKWRENVAYPIPPAAVEESGEMRITFVNHSTFLVQFKGWNILTDPHFSQRASPVSWAGPKRVRLPGVAFGDLPRVDLVLISHNHYDHMDLPTLKSLEKAHRPIFLVPLGNAAFLRGQGLGTVEEFDWWQERAFDNGVSIRVTLTPAQHFAARGIFDRNKTLWGGFMVSSDEAGRIFFAGDTGYSPHFKSIREKLGAPDVALLPIAAYEPRWFMKAMHMNPEDAFQAHRDLESRRSFGMHFGTFQLTDEAIDEPIERLTSLVKAASDSGEFVAPFHTIDFGETFVIREAP